MIPYTWLEQAKERIAPYIKSTPLTYDPNYDLYLKWENHQVTGSFKLRGALNKVLSLQDWELESGLVTASAGNHGQGVALAGKIKRAPVIVFVSRHASQNKIQAMRDFGANIHLVDGGYAEAEVAGIDYARKNHAIWISPYNDGIVIAGQGTIGIEIIDALPKPTPPVWIVPAGGGGLVSGIGCAIQMITPKPRLVAVQSEASPFLHAFFYHGTPAGVVEQHSLADGLAGAVEEGSVTLPIVNNYVDEILLVSELEIRKAIKFAWKVYHEGIEGSAAVTLAAVLSDRISERPAVVIVTGGNIHPSVHAKIISDQALGEFEQPHGYHS
jgi:threonine dehydratase